MIEVLKTARGLWRRFKFLFFNIFYLWTTTFVFLLEINYYDIFVLFAPSN
jgi:hypothetical protein